MRALRLFTMVVAGLLTWGAAIAAETTFIPPTAPTATFIVPLNLTNLYPDVKEVGVSCSGTTWKPVVVRTPVVAGRVLTTLEVVVPLAPPTGARLTWRCELFLFGSDPNMPYFASTYGNPKEFSITPGGQALTGEFVW